MMLVLITFNTKPIFAETYNIALSLSNHGTYADAYGAGIGPTAHTPPLLPMMLALIVRIVGTGPAGKLLQSTLACIAAALSFALLPVLARECQLGGWCGVSAGIIGAIAPVNFWAQTTGYFDAPYTMLGLTALCIAMCGYWMRAYFPLRAAIYLGLLSGILCLLNATILQILVGWSLFGLWNFKQNLGKFSIFMATIAAVILMCLLPWAQRNFKSLGQPIWTRSNFGLELQVSNNDEASADAEVNMRSPSNPHPHTEPKERERVRKMGELAYMQAKKAEALFWMRSHPGRLFQLMAFRIFYFWFPPMTRWWQSCAEAVTTLLAFAGLITLFRKKHPSALILFAVLLFYPAIYLVIQVSPRYRCPIEPILLLLGCFFCVDLAKAFSGNRALRRLINDDLAGQPS